MLRFSNAGHNPIVYYNSQILSCRLVELKGCVLKLAKKCVHDIKEISSQPNDLFLIYTDSVMEAVNENQELFEEVRLPQVIEEAAAAKSADNIRMVFRRKILACPG